MVSAILTGVNRTYPFTKGPQNLLDHIDHLFRYIHTVTAQVGIQILMLLYQVMEREGAITDRFYMALYRKMTDSDLLQHSGRSSSLLNLLYKAMKRDPEVRRVKAFIKRILQLAMTQSTPFICGALIVISEVIRSKPNSFRSKLFQVSAVAEPVDDSVKHEGTGRHILKRLVAFISLCNQIFIEPIDRLIDWLIFWFFIRWFDWLVDWLIDCLLIDWSVYWLIDWLIACCIGWLIDCIVFFWLLICIISTLSDFFTFQSHYWSRLHMLRTRFANNLPSIFP